MPPRRAYAGAKRALDLVGAALLLIATAPVLLLLAVVIRLDSSGPVLFRQARVGRGGRLFTVLKLRTMVVGAPAHGPKPTSTEDARLTRLGGWLRRTSLDELPQLLNVLAGQMSLVGPRPELPQLVARYQPWQRRRLDVLPGLTGWWQVNGRRQPMHDHVEDDLYYVDNQGLGLDLCILVRTVGVVLSRRGAS
jgi:lipopolysaccharide/colanic/teichoic acid biosynthesis glycosyltransferase